MSIEYLTATDEAKSGFYPTPPALAEKLLSGIDWDMIEDMLEPSAGKGNIVRAVAEKYATGAGWSKRKINIDCVEIDPYLRSILRYEFCGQRENEIYARLEELRQNRQYSRETGYYSELTADEAAEQMHLREESDMFDKLSLHIVHDDFLTFQSRKHYGLIAMNPPFADGDAHLLKAIEMQRDSGMIRCILNAETLRNPYTNRRRLLANKLQELNAQIEYIDGAFSDSERKTDVTVALIRIDVPAKKRESTIFERLRKAAKLDEQSPVDVTDMTVSDFMEQIVSRFNVEADAGIELIREYEAMEPYIHDSFDDKKYSVYPTLTLCVGETNSLSRGSIPNVNEYLRLVRKKYWEALFSNKAFIGKLTSNLRKEYIQKVDAMSEFDFTLFNIKEIAEQMSAEMNNGIQETIVALFDKLTQEHSWYPECAKNIHYYNGWKTNKAHKINSKVIIPTYGVFSSYSWSKETFNVHEAESTISDIEKVFDYLDGNKTSSIDLHGVLLRACEEGRTRNIGCKYFDVTLYKKGTMHIKFRNQELVDRFNIYCCRKKSWLPPNYGRTVYDDMSVEERMAVDGFHGDGDAGSGKAGYRAVMEKAAYFLAEPAQELPALAAPAVL